MRIALLEDDPDQSKLIEVWLSDAGYQCYSYTSGEDIVRALSKETFDLLILDWEVPEMSGYEVLVWARKNLDWYCPILFVTKREEEGDIVRALESGADDYMTKPIKHAEMLARISAISRRNEPSKNSQKIFECEPYKFDLVKRTIWVQQQEVDMTQKEFELALFIFKNSGRILSRGYILERVWGKNPEINTRTVDTHMSRLRRKLNINEENGWMLTSVYQHGYRLESIS